MTHEPDSDVPEVAYSPPCITDLDAADDEFAVIPAIQTSPQ